MSNYPIDIKKFEAALGVEFNDKNLLVSAVVHRSYLNENPGFALTHNERLEFLGDAVVELVVTEYLYKTYPNPEGELTNWRSALVNYRTLAGRAQALGVNDFLLLSRGESRDNGRARQIILANAYESIVGAIYLDQGYEQVAEFIKRDVLPLLPDILQKGTYLDPKSKFQEISQAQTGVTPEYRVLHEVGPDHAKEFTIGVFVGHKQLGSGVGLSKQEAESQAAENALQHIEELTQIQKKKS